MTARIAALLVALLAAGCVGPTIQTATWQVTTGSLGTVETSGPAGNVKGGPVSEEAGALIGDELGWVCAAFPLCNPGKLAHTHADE